jgi:hypothetical protein
LIQKYISDSSNLHGNITLEKKCIANLIDLIRVAPNSARVFILLTAYASRNNTVITDVRSISKILGIHDINFTKAAVNCLIENGYITMKTIKINTERGIEGVLHDRFLYDLSDKETWEVIGTKHVLDFKINGEFNIITINEDFAYGEECTEEGSNLILHIRNRLFYDTAIMDEEIEMGIKPDTYI